MWHIKLNFGTWWAHYGLESIEVRIYWGRGYWSPFIRVEKNRVRIKNKTFRDIFCIIPEQYRWHRIQKELDKLESPRIKSIVQSPRLKGDKGKKRKGKKP